MWVLEVAAGLNCFETTVTGKFLCDGRVLGNFQ